MSTTANAPSPSAETTIFLMSRRLWTRVWVSNSSCHPRLQRSALKRPHTMTHVMGSCACAVGGQGQTMAGWKQETSRSASRSEEHTSELQSQSNLVCRLLLEKKKKNQR